MSITDFNLLTAMSPLVLNSTAITEVEDSIKFYLAMKLCSHYP